MSPVTPLPAYLEKKEEISAGTFFNFLSYEAGLKGFTRVPPIILYSG